MGGTLLWGYLQSMKGAMLIIHREDAQKQRHVNSNAEAIHNKNNQVLLLHRSRKTYTKMATMKNLKLIMRKRIMEFHPHVKVT